MSSHSTCVHLFTVDLYPITGRVRKDGGKSGDGQKLPPEVRQYIKEKWQEIVTEKLGFQNLKEMREAWHKEQKQKVQFD